MPGYRIGGVRIFVSGPFRLLRILRKAACGIVRRDPHERRRRQAKRSAFPRRPTRASRGERAFMTSEVAKGTRFPPYRLLDGWRGFAALAVVVYHAVPSHDSQTPPLYLAP